MGRVDIFFKKKTSLQVTIALKHKTSRWTVFMMYAASPGDCEALQLRITATVHRRMKWNSKEIDGRRTEGGGGHEVRQ